MTELVSADSVRILKEAPAPNEIIPHRAANTVTNSISDLQKLMQGPASIYSDFDEYKTANATTSDSECPIETKRCRSRKKKKRRRRSQGIVHPPSITTGLAKTIRQRRMIAPTARSSAA